MIHPAKAIMVAEIILSPACGLHKLLWNQKQGAAFSSKASYTRTNKNAPMERRFSLAGLCKNVP
jgi:hypothetical protein